MKETKIGKITGGSIASLTASCEADVELGSFVVIHDGARKFWGTITELSHPQVPAELASMSLTGSRFQPEAGINLKRMSTAGDEPLPVKQLPSLGSEMHEADQSDIERLFGPSAPPNWVIGTMGGGHNLPIDLEKLVKRPMCILGATGTGKSFTAKVVMAGLIQNKVGGNLIFDFHGDYTVLKDMFPSQVRLVTLGSGMTGDRQPDFNLEISPQTITPRDILNMSTLLNMTDNAYLVLQGAVAHFGDRWFKSFTGLNPHKVVDPDKVPLPGSLAHFSNLTHLHPASVRSTWAKLQGVANKGYIHQNKSLTNMIDSLENGKTVVVNFGRFETDMDLILVSNILSRIIRSRWVEKTNEFRSGQSKQAPTPLTIWLEEAHKLLNSEVARQTTFGILAREMRKFGVTLAVIDQRPSEIDPDVMSQMGTRISGWLGDSSDIRGTLAGISDRGLSEQLARLAPKQEAVIMGWGVPIPVTVKVRDFFELQKELKGKSIKSTQSAEESIKELGFA
jgi:hypothetical protein